jgi:hypothetical protein
LPDDAVDSVLQATDHFLLSKAEDVSVEGLELLSNGMTTPSQYQSALHALFYAAEELGDKVCPVVSNTVTETSGLGRISQTALSPEDLPRDAPFQETMGEILQKAEVTSKSGHDTTGVSGATSEEPSSRSLAPPPAPSITSLDNGYQGDREWSHSASRGADHCPTNHWVIKLKTSGADSMTDSDFFTESDADTHDDIMGAGTGHGDRRAQVINGKLYGTNLNAGQQHQRCLSFTASVNEEMESSTVRRGMETRRGGVAEKYRALQN